MQPPTIHPDPSPLRIDADGVIRIGTGRLTLAAVVEAWNEEVLPVSIAAGFRIPLPDLLAAMAYYFRHQAELKPYLDYQANKAGELRAEIEAGQKPFPTRAELEERRGHRHAETGK